MELWLQAYSRAATSDLNSRLRRVGSRLQMLESHVAPLELFPRGWDPQDLQGSVRLSSGCVHLLLSPVESFSPASLA